MIKFPLLSQVKFFSRVYFTHRRTRGIPFSLYTVQNFSAVCILHIEGQEVFPSLYLQSIIFQPSSFQWNVYTETIYTSIGQGFILTFLYTVQLRPVSISQNLGHSCFPDLCNAQIIKLGDTAMYFSVTSIPQYPYHRK